MALIFIFNLKLLEAPEYLAFIFEAVNIKKINLIILKDNKILASIKAS